MSGATDGEAILKEMVDGLEGVTPGPWKYRPNKFDDWGLIRASEPVFGYDAGFPLAHVRTYFGGDIEQHELDIARHRADGTDPCFRNGQHITRCCPDNIRAVADYAAAIKSERDAALERVAVLEKALTRIANACTPRMSKSIGEERCGAIAAQALKEIT